MKSLKKPGLLIQIEEEDPYLDEDAPMVTPSYITKLSDDPMINQIKDQNQKLQLEVSQIPSTPNNNKDPVENQFVAHDPDQDYFMMSVLALKMIHNEMYDDTDYCFYISPPQLWKEVKAVDMPFHKWYKFVE